jgi:hypothetical protein
VSFVAKVKAAFKKAGARDTRVTTRGSWLARLFAHRAKSLKWLELNGRGERIRTSGPCLPKAVLYQAELHPDWVSENMGPMHRQNDRVNAKSTSFDRALR